MHPRLTADQLWTYESPFGGWKLQNSGHSVHGSPSGQPSASAQNRAQS